MSHTEEFDFEVPIDEIVTIPVPEPSNTLNGGSQDPIPSRELTDIALERQRSVQLEAHIRAIEAQERAL